MMEKNVPPPGAETPGFSIDLPRASQQAIVRTVAGVIAAGLGAFAAFTLVQNRTKPVAVSVVVPATSKRAPVSVSGKSARVRRDTFLSNFAQARISDFGTAGMPAEEKVRFALVHVQRHSPRQIQTDPSNGKRYVAAGQVEKTAGQYFGDAPRGENRYYLSPTATSAETSRFARVESWEAVLSGNNDRFAATVRVYEPPAGWKVDPYTWAMSTNPAPKDPRFVGRWRATLRSVPGGDYLQPRYVLLSWKRI
ncbi:MAG: hypothetical protein H8F28_10900 [Fibrella sp.]|nr:hypothetical protein [Armatimonadota bacterium]